MQFRTVTVCYSCSNNCNGHNYLYTIDLIANIGQKRYSFETRIDTYL